ncbi:putative bifunctional diguanylate cyclase/phosphodiesterase [Rhizobium sp. CC-YZS058]|uniref:putative bifunctional diguanylate cyclase/phosphodiesterase n=1 Tax=Rhizobium sp. CC-YZS058 TaxID=3042153 RepID=UPI002B0596E6|nr:EAL domain-containing protein [Rhizobium sp. CC-YZS058]MEA3537015.1 EAL domain-containing protein [Rhizobium sp. CC-YZS058]
MFKNIPASASLQDDSDFRSIFKFHPSPMWVYEPDTLRFLAVNRAALQLYGYPADSYPSMTVLDLRPESERQRMREAVRRRDDIERAEKWTHRKADGSLFEVLTYGREIRFGGQNAILAIVQDQSELQSARQTASDTRALYDAIVDHLPIGIFVRDMHYDGRFAVFNAACGDHFGVDASQALANKGEQMLGWLGTDASLSTEKAALQAGSAVTLEERICGSDETVRFIRTTRQTLPVSEDEHGRYVLGLSQDISSERAAAERLSHIALHDGLTGLPNRANFTEVLDRRLRHATPSAGLGLIYIDVDNFKMINDTWGHSAGDAVLLEVAARLRRQCSRGELPVRLGGDEFAVVFSAPAEAQAESLCGEILKTLEKPFCFENRLIPVTCSLGAAMVFGTDGGAEALLRNADFALYAAKGSGRNCFRLFKPEMRMKAEERAVLLSEMTHALAHDPAQFEVFFQPVFDVFEGSLSGYEALARWNHPDRGMIPPLQFIPIAEESGLIVQLGELILDKSCTAAAEWPSELTVAVNVSARQFDGCGLVASVVSALDRSGLAGPRLEIEITESMFIRDTVNFIPTLRSLKALGVRIAIDDFGTGYSSLSYLRSFEFDKIKLDRSFLAGIESNAPNLSIIRAVIGIGRGFGAAVLAEGVETSDQLDLVTKEGFSHVQGYLFGKPARHPARPAFPIPARRVAG